MKWREIRKHYPQQWLLIERVCRLAGYEPPIICTPQELLEE